MEKSIRIKMIVQLLLCLMFISTATPASIVIPDAETGFQNQIDRTYPDLPELKRPKRHLAHYAKLWPQGKVIYNIDASISRPYDILRIHYAAVAISNATCVKFINRTKENEKEPYVSLRRLDLNGRPACQAEIGFRNNHPQWVTITPDDPENICYGNGKKFVGVVAHELMHVLGFLHESQRQDRDYYIGASGTVAKLPGNSTGLPFDYKSITLYELKKYGYGVLYRPDPKIRPKTPAFGTLEDVGHLCKLSALDRTLIDRIYANECGLKQLTDHKNPYPLATGVCEGTIHYIEDEKLQ